MEAQELMIRPIHAEEQAAWLQAVGRGFGHVMSDEDAAEDAATRGPVEDPARVQAAFDGDRMVATYRSFATTLSMPGGAEIPASGVTAVTTTSTHRRRGLASRMVTDDLFAARERGEAVAVLLAAEWPIYGRFGFGPATDERTLVLHPGASLFTRTPRGSVRLLPNDQARQLAPAIFADHRAHRAGEIEPQPFGWDLDFGLVSLRGFREVKPHFCAVAFDEADHPIGYARYRVEEKWVRNQPASEAIVSALVGIDTQAELLLWKHIADHDLVRTVRAPGRPMDDPLPWLVNNPRDVERTDETDFLWVRLLDVEGAFSGRSSSGNDRVILEVVDRLGLVEGRYSLAADGGAFSVARTTRSADATLDVAMLGALLLGGRSAVILREAGLVDAHTIDACERLDRMLATSRAPWCSIGF